MYLASDFLTRYFEFNGIVLPSTVVLNTYVQMILDEEDAECDNDVFGDMRQKAVFLRTAHLLSLKHRINLAPSGVKDLSNPGISSGKQVAGHSVSEQSQLPALLLQWKGDWRSFYARTVYGLEYLKLCECSLPNAIASF
jgi:hypothetical protein